VNLKVEDYYPSGKRFLLRFKEKGGKEKELPVHQESGAMAASTPIGLRSAFVTCNNQSTLKQTTFRQKS
jgi:hypothetical protein